MNALRITALVASVLCLAILVSPALASGPVTSTTAAPAVDGAFVSALGIGVVPASASDPLVIGQTLYVSVQSTRLLIAAMNAATANGATQVNANSGKGGAPFGTVQPSAADLAKATQAALANARTNAEALAAASGRKVGPIRSISSSQLPMMRCRPPNSGWTGQVTVTLDFAP